MFRNIGKIVIVVARGGSPKCSRPEHVAHATIRRLFILQLQGNVSVVEIGMRAEKARLWWALAAAIIAAIVYPLLPAQLRCARRPYSVG